VAEKISLVAAEYDLVAEEDEDLEIIQEVLHQPSGSTEKYRRRWIEFDCQKGVHHGKYATYENKKRIRVPGGYLGRFDKVRASGRAGKQRVDEFIANHNCRYPDRFYKDMDECGVNRIEVEGWPSGRSVSRLPGSGRLDRNERG
jgi:hypothetical protein